MQGLSDVIAIFILFSFWAALLLFGSRLMKVFLDSPIDFANFDGKPLLLGLSGSILVLVALMAVGKK